MKIEIYQRQNSFTFSTRCGNFKLRPQATTLPHTTVYRKRELLNTDICVAMSEKCTKTKICFNSVKNKKKKKKKKKKKRIQYHLGKESLKFNPVFN